MRNRPRIIVRPFPKPTTAPTKPHNEEILGLKPPFNSCVPRRRDEDSASRYKRGRNNSVAGRGHPGRSGFGLARRGVIGRAVPNHSLVTVAENLIAPRRLQTRRRSEVLRPGWPRAD